MITPANWIPFITTANTTIRQAWSWLQTEYQQYTTTVPLGESTQFEDAWIGRMAKMRMWSGPRVYNEPAPQTYNFPKPRLAPAPGQRRVASGSGHTTTSVGGEEVSGAHHPGKGSSSSPPGHSACAGSQGRQLPLAPHAQALPAEAFKKGCRV